MKYTIDNPKLIDSISNYNPRSFTGVVKDKYGDITYYKNGKKHREDGPAVIYTHGYKEWRIHGAYHREDGPAVEYSDGDKRWYYNNECYGKFDDFTVESWIKKWKLEMFK